MSYRNHDFIGITSSQLPYVHDSFPAAGPKYYTMRSVYRGGDSNRKRDPGLRQSQPIRLDKDNKVVGNISLPKLQLELEAPKPKINVDPLIQQSGNINRQKAYYKLKGIYVDQVFSVNRAKNTPRDGSLHPNNQEAKIRIAKPKRKSSISSRQSNATLPIVNFKLPSINTSSERFSETRTPGAHSLKSESSMSEYRSRLREMDRESSPIPGIKRKNKTHLGRKLGNVVSSKRLQQLLDRDDSLDPGSFFFF